MICYIFATSMAIDCFRQFTEHNNTLQTGQVFLPEQMMIRLQMDERIFERYADEMRLKALEKENARVNKFQPRFEKEDAKE